MRTLKKITLILLLLVWMLLFGAQQVFAETVRERVARLQDALNAIAQDIEVNKGDIMRQKQVRSAYQTQQEVLRQQIEAMNEEIAQDEAALTQKQAEVDQKIVEVELQRTLFEERLVAQYTNCEKNELSYLLGAESWKFRARFGENLQCIAVQDTQIEQNLRTQQAELEQQKQEMIAALEQLEQQRAALAGKVDELAASIRQTDASIDDAQAHLGAQSTAYGQTEEEMKQATAELQRWLTANSKVDFEYGGGVFAWPIPGHSRVSSDFGLRNLWGFSDFHRGVDFRAPAGTPIVAAESGVVGTRADASYGTCVKINHGSGLLTLYAHMSARADGITDGKFVSKGEVVGYVGTTGRSDGNHLHFEVNLNGAVVTPWTYLNG